MPTFTIQPVAPNFWELLGDRQDSNIASLALAAQIAQDHVSGDYEAVGVQALGESNYLVKLAVWTTYDGEEHYEVAGSVRVDLSGPAPYVSNTMMI